MARRPAQQPIDYEGLAAHLRVLGYATRLELLHHLRFPAPVGDLRVQPRRAGGAGGRERAAARETVRTHLERLVEVGLVRVDRVEADGKPLNSYGVNLPKMYGLVEEMRRIFTQVLRGGPNPSKFQRLSNA